MPQGSLVDVFMATESFSAALDGEVVYVSRGDLVRAGHPLLRGREELFVPATDRVRFEVEQATARPGELR